MRNFGLLIFAAGLMSSAILSPGADAADMPLKAPAAVASPVYSWTGFYVGANVGGGWGHNDVTYAPNDPIAANLFNPVLDTVPPAASFKTSGVIGGLQLGYNWQVNRNWLIGIETDFDWSGMKGSSTTAFAGPSDPTSTTVDERIKWFGTVRARLGYLPMDNLLTYVTGGFAYGRVEHSANYVGNNFGVTGFGLGFFCAPGLTCFAGSSNDIATGWTLGGGLEYALWQKWSLKAEYLYVSLGSKSVTEFAVSPGGFAPASFNANFGRTTFNVARVGLNYRFSGH